MRDESIQCRFLGALILAACLAVPGGADEPKPDPIKVQRRVRELITKLAGPGESQREEAAEGLWDLGPLARDAGPALAKALKDASPRVRLYAAGALLRIDQANCKDALPVVVAILKDPKAPFLEAMGVCGQLQPIHKDLIAGLLDMVRNDHPMVVVSGISALDNVGPEAKEAAPLFEAALTDRKTEVRLAVSGALLRIDPMWKKKVQPVAEEILKSPSYATRVGATEVLLKIDTALGAKAAEALASGLESKNIDDRLTVATTLVELAPEKAGAVATALSDGLKDAEENTRRSCAEKLGAIGRYGASAEKALRTAAEDKEPTVAVAAAEALLHVVPEKAGELLPILVAQRDRRDKSEAGEVLKLLGVIDKLADEQIKREKKPVVRREMEMERVDGLIEQVSKPDARKYGDMIQLHAAIKLAQLGPGAREAAPRITRLLDEVGGLTRQQLVLALGKIGPNARAAVPALLAIYRDRSNVSIGMRHEAAEAIKAIDPRTAKREGVR